MLRRKVKVGLLVLIAAIAAVVSYKLDGHTGLTGAALGIAFGLLLSVASHFAVQRVRSVAPSLLPATMFLGVGTSMLFMGIFIGVVAAVRREILVPATITSLTIYLVYRFFEAFEVSQVERRREVAAGPMVSKGASR